MAATRKTIKYSGHNDWRQGIGREKWAMPLSPLALSR
jgi:hypothetical protein